MNRRIFLAQSAAAATLLLARKPDLYATQNAVILRGGHVIDGTGAPGRDLDVAMTHGRISAVGSNLQVARAKIIDVRGLVVAPGFIDIHSHTGKSLFTDPTAQSKVRQGVTTEIAGQDGSSIVDLAAFFEELAQRGASVNLASMVGAGTVRNQVIGETDRPATAAEIEQMQALVRAALGAGACGLSSGLEYVPGAFADRNELVALASVLVGTGLPYASHMRNEDDALLAAVEEAITIGRFAKVPVHISHLKSQGARNWYKTSAVIETIESANRDGSDVTFDRYPYIAYNTGLSNLFRYGRGMAARTSSWNVSPTRRSSRPSAVTSRTRSRSSDPGIRSRSPAPARRNWHGRAANGWAHWPRSAINRPTICFSTSSRRIVRVPA